MTKIKFDGFSSIFYPYPKGEIEENRTPLPAGRL